MAQARRVEEWGRAAELMALIANCHRDPDKRRQPYTARDICPWLPKPPKPKRDIEKADISILKVFLPGHGQ